MTRGNVAGLIYVDDSPWMYGAAARPGGECESRLLTNAIKRVLSPVRGTGLIALPARTGMSATLSGLLVRDVLSRSSEGHAPDGRTTKEH